MSGRKRLPVAFELPQSRLAFWAALETLGEPQSIFAYWAELRAHRKREITSALTRDRCTSAFKFPLSVDHRLFVLIQHNALRGVMTNMSILLHLNGQPFEGLVDFYTEGLSTPPDNGPSSLQPTYLQKTITHESWIDVIPWATMRDNVIRNQDNLDADALCEDFLGGMEEGLSDVQNRGLILWSEPWSEKGWEISEGFAKKWAFLLKGCSDLLESTNSWREARGEERLIVEV